MKALGIENDFHLWRLSIIMVKLRARYSLWHSNSRKLKIISIGGVNKKLWDFAWDVVLE